MLVDLIFKYDANTNDHCRDLWFPFFDQLCFDGDEKQSDFASHGIFRNMVSRQ